MITGRYGTDRDRPTDSRLAGIGGAHAAEKLSARNLAIADAVSRTPNGAETAPHTPRLTNTRAEVDALLATRAEHDTDLDQ